MPRPRAARAEKAKAASFGVSWSTDRRFRSNSAIRIFRPSISLRAIKQTSLPKDLGLGCRHGRAIGTMPESLPSLRALPEWVWRWFRDSAKKSMNLGHWPYGFAARLAASRNNFRRFVLLTFGLDFCPFSFRRSARVRRLCGAHPPEPWQQPGGGPAHGVNTHPPPGPPG